MSSNIAIKVSNISKVYKIFDKPTHRFRQFFSKLKFYKEFKALQNVSLQIPKGTTIGIVGNNGSGKSTLLQIICGTLFPTSGNVTVNGKISALLELGTGFNNEFTGLENVYLSAAVAGLSKKEIDKQFDSILEFSELGNFINQPVKTYSSGMYIRLAFSVAIHVNPDILIIDEALAVGDISFQMKCLEKIEEFRKKNKTIVFVSHSLEQVKRFCNYSYWIEDGKIRLHGETNYVCDQYRSSMFNSSKSANTKKINKFNNDKPAIITSVSLSGEKLKLSDDLIVNINYKILNESIPNFLLGVALKDSNRTYIFGPNTYLDKFKIPNKKGEHSIRYIIEKIPLISGRYYIDVGLFTNAGIVNVDYLNDVKFFDVISKYNCEGIVRMNHKWIVNE